MEPHPDIQNLVRVAEMETKRIEDLRREQGWSPWVLYAAIAALLWHLVEEPVLPHHWRYIWLYWAGGVLLMDAARSVFRILSWAPLEPMPSHGPRFVPANLFLSSGRVCVIYNFAKLAAAIGITLWMGHLTGFLWLFWICLFVAQIIGAVATIMATFTGMAWGISPIRPAVYFKVIGYTILVLDLLAVAWLFHRAMPILQVRFVPADFKVALLMFAAGEVGALIFSIPIYNQITGRLMRIRRGIGMGEYTYDEAHQQLTEAIYGTSPEVLLRPKFEALLKEAESIDTACKELDSREPVSHARLGSGSATVDPVVTALVVRIESLTTKMDLFEVQVVSIVQQDMRAEEKIAEMRTTLKSSTKALKTTAAVLKGHAVAD